MRHMLWIEVPCSLWLGLKGRPPLCGRGVKGMNRKSPSARAELESVTYIILLILHCLGGEEEMVVKEEQEPCGDPAVRWTKRSRLAAPEPLAHFFSTLWNQTPNLRYHGLLENSSSQFNLANK